MEDDSVEAFTRSIFTKQINNLKETLNTIGK